MGNDKLYFPGLNGLRSIASLTVVFCHIDLFSGLFGLRKLGFSLGNTADHAVTLFFVLSGFLITLLLLKEKSIKSDINIRNFYIRRILRIWPLYYTIIIITLLLVPFLPTIGYDRYTLVPSVMLFAFLMANISYVFFFFSTLAPLWSVGVEEQFYLVWPWIVKNSKKLPLFLFVFIFAYLVITYGLRVFENGVFYELFRLSSFDCMAFGAIGAWMVFNKSRYLVYLYHIATQLVAVGLIFFSEVLYKYVHIPNPVQREYYALLFLVVILNVSTNQSSFIKLENRFFDFLGKISYGIYMYHMLVISVLAFFLRPVLVAMDFGYASVIVYMSVLAFTIFVSAISYFYYEMRFLSLKDAYGVIHSSNSRW